MDRKTRKDDFAVIKKGIVWAGIMVFLCSCFIFGTEFSRRPDVEAVCEYLLSLPEYVGAEPVENFEGAYEELSKTNIKDLKVYKANDATSKELAVMLAEEIADREAAISILNARTEEQKAEFDDNEEEQKRIDKARIVSANGFLIYTVYDIEGVAENAVYKYFAAR